MTTVIIKPTDGCNARCLYCSAAHAGAAQRMTSGVLRSVFRLFAGWAARSRRDRLAFIWHGGEPLLMPTSFWEDVFALQEEVLAARGIAFENRLQSNLTCLDAENLPVVKRLVGERGVVGTSADPLEGIRELKGSRDGDYAERWSDSLRLLEAAGVRYGILYVVHRRSLPHLGSVYRHFREHHSAAGLRFNPLYRQGRAASSGVWGDLGITAKEWGEALVCLHEEWTRDGRPDRVQPLASWWKLRSGGKWRLSCECSGRCVENHFGVDPAGDIFLCGRSADGRVLRFGNAVELAGDRTGDPAQEDLPDRGVEVLSDHPLRRALAHRKIYLERTFCRRCPWWLYCHGGCINDGLLEQGTPFAPTSLCEGLRHYFDHAFGAAGGKGDGWAA